MVRKIVLRPVISTLQRMAVFDVKDKLTIVGSNNNETLFRILHINRMVPKDLEIIDDGVEYTRDEIDTFLRGIGRSNVKKVSAFGIVGFVKFMESYYLILVTKRRRVAAIGLHYIYKIEDTEMIYIANEAIRVTHRDEARYLKMFQSIDLRSNFYFSYSYDITHTLQVNMAIPRAIKDDLESHSRNESKRNEYFEYEIKGKPNRKFVWNNYLLSQVEGHLNSNWILPIMHGFVSQSIVSIFGRSVFVTLIARRSNKYAGTRFLKRGANLDGDVANEVETEQIVEDMGVSSWNICPRISSFVQMRGSIPGHWSQDIKLVPKPSIYYDLTDPFVETPGKHFKMLHERYGSPIVVLNLVKQREKKKHESTLSEQFRSDILYLNQFLPPEHEIQYVPFDMARKNKGIKANVLGSLEKIAENAISKTGMYIYNPLGEKFQTGIIRVNCVDCLDRTNTAQFALGKYALACQLKSLGFLSNEELNFDCDCTRMLEVLYEDHGDTLALQYGGSQLVHRIKTYRKTAPWTSQGNDIMQTLSRYVSNTFSDAEKQHAMNVFLGLFIPSENSTPIWELTTDYYLHNPSTMRVNIRKETRLPLTQWWGEEVHSLAKNCRDRDVQYFRKVDKNSKVDAYSDFHRPNEYIPFSDLFIFTMTHTLRDFAPQYITDFSPFTVRRGPGRRREETKGTRNPSLSGHCSTNSNTSSDSSCQESEDEEPKIESKQQSSPAKQSLQLYEVPPPPPLVSIKMPSAQDTLLYKSYVVMQRKATYMKDNYSQLANVFNPVTKFNFESSFEVSVPKVSTESRTFYENYVNKCYDTLDKCLTSKQIEEYIRYTKNEFIGLKSMWEY
ncbi:polyphosphoinositide phosphatase isoform X2 [Cimex lectularius]|uniref:SAC domain-containing protein n=1 Tax=Cimex lectularius TaxID=79782 RepID=A0A8I6TLH9_CIMLE|nr:polyphosphoinositide phosphatase isoform X2 [Cimex lectularius]